MPDLVKCTGDGMHRCEDSSCVKNIKSCSAETCRHDMNIRTALHRILNDLSWAGIREEIASVFTRASF